MKKILSSNWEDFLVFRNNSIPTIISSLDMSDIVFICITCILYSWPIWYRNPAIVIVCSLELDYHILASWVIPCSEYGFISDIFELHELFSTNIDPSIGSILYWFYTVLSFLYFDRIWISNNFFSRTANYKETGRNYDYSPRSNISHIFFLEKLYRIKL